MKTNVFVKCLKGVVLLLASLKGWFLGQKMFHARQATVE